MTQAVVSWNFEVCEFFSSSSSSCKQDCGPSLQLMSSFEVGTERLALSLDWSTGRMDRYVDGVNLSNPALMQRLKASCFYGGVKLHLWRPLSNLGVNAF